MMEKKIGNAPLVLRGGYVGDFWGPGGERRQRFLQTLIARYTDRPIVLMPQSLAFADPENLRTTAAILNAHPHLTLLARDDDSYTIAENHFQNCHVIKSPDSVFHLVDMPGLRLNVRPTSSILYLRRQDWEPGSAFSPAALNIPDLVVEEWISSRWMSETPEGWPYIPGFVRLIREGWQRGLATPREWLSRQRWLYDHPYAAKFNAMDQPWKHRHSWSLMHSGLYQLQQHRLVITNRLHGHILCMLLGIPHVLIPGPYQKMKAVYDTWTHHIPFCRYVEEAGQVKHAVEELLTSYPV